MCSEGLIHLYKTSKHVMFAFKLKVSDYLNVFSIFIKISF